MWKGGVEEIKSGKSGGECWRKTGKVRQQGVERKDKMMEGLSQDWEGREDEGMSTKWDARRDKE